MSIYGTDTVTLPPWPPPVHVRPALRRARRRLHALRPSCRPSLSDPSSCLGLFPPLDLLALAQSGCWPLPSLALGWLGEPPAERARRRKRREQRIAAVVREVMVAELPEAINYLSGGKS